MTNDSRNPEEIEREIERERAGLADTLDDLQDRFSVEGIARQFSDQFREHGGDWGRSISDAAKRNPVALALTGAGLAWMMFGSGNSRDRRGYEGLDRDRAHPVPVPVTNTENRPAVRGARRSSAPASAYATSYGSERGAADDVPAWARDVHHDDDDGRGFGDRARSAAGSVKGAAGSAASGVSGAAGSAAGSVKGAASSAAGRARSAGSSVASGARYARDRASYGTRSAVDSIRSTASGAAHSVRDSANAANERAHALRDRLSEGTENMTAEARERIVMARARAVDAWNAGGRYARQGGERASDMFEEHPMVAGALALAVGAAIGAALPRSRTEDAYMGEHSDALFNEAERIYAEERDKLGKVAKAATDEAGKVLKETKDNADAAADEETAADAAVKKAKESGQRVADAAKSEADKQKLGDVKS
ncbi:MULTISPECIES: DUF3618 domain-containing protein [Sulfitobacter]|uniref:DUF3618 domain-containing protein n=1 Tax=Sulfitobacter TaxID=60136 RepID=UPI0007C26338|nr:MULTISPECIES: DUF3618 domain-containing protein [Sulfitobacter]KZY50859.1 hypothetical protein A3734_06985 [Sulfitobacter sp. HI0054]MBO9439451.1 DUF3618 domain-containing protein [Sulfitobacter sp. R18_2]MDH4539070.1 DUF3618 domain-containing protein [Sulfitobacter faviae]TKA85779.1 DUF3618 domain-containing protein [Sulfitobacter sp. 15WGC]